MSFAQTSNPEYSKFIALSKYARWLPEEGRRENWEETVKRYIDFFIRKFPFLAEEGPKCQPSAAEELFHYIHDLKVMPSMRALMTAGEALERDNVAGFNCAYREISGEGKKLKVHTEEMKELGMEPVSIAVSKPTAFDEIMYILMCGTGVGVSCERQFIASLPIVGHKLAKKTYNRVEANYPGVDFNELSYLEYNIIQVVDSKYGWASALRILLIELYNGNFSINWDLSMIRAAGLPLKIFGGRASGPKPLDDLFNYCVELFQKAKGRRLSSIEVHGLVCKIAEIVVVGGVRRCLPHNSLIQTKTGSKEIKDLNIGDIIESGGEAAKVIEVINSGKQKILNIKHQYGNLNCTENHRVAIFNNYAEIVFKSAKDLTVEDTLVWDSVGYTGTHTKMPTFTKKLHFNAKKFIIPEIDVDIAWLIGLIHGDGHIAERTIEITAALKETHLLEQANEIFIKFKLQGNISSGNGKCNRLRINSKDLCDWFKLHIKVANQDIKIPKFITEATKEIRYAYLAGLFDSDGRSRQDNIIEQVTSIYPNFSREINSLLKGLGIGNNIHFNSAQKRRNQGVNAKDFYNINIRGITNRKEWLNTVGKYSTSGKLFNTTVSIGNGNDFKYKTEMLGSPKGWKKGKNITLASAIDNEFINNPIFYPTQIQSIELREKVETYDIEIENLHYFTTEGILVHNSALISLSNLSDNRMRTAKSGQWWIDNPEFSLANNSICYTEQPDSESFMKEWLALIESKSGERGIFNRVASKNQAAKNGRRDTNKEFGTNPCSEIILRNQQFCNLSEVVVREGDSLDTLKEKVRIATIIGTLQSSLTDFKYLNPEWSKNTKEEALLGVSLTGIMDHPILSGSLENRPDIERYPYVKQGFMYLSDTLEELKEVAIETNKTWAKKLGINPSVAITCVKPSGTVSQLVDSASGIHPRYSEFYIRTVRADKKDPLAIMMLDKGFPCANDIMSPTSTLIFSFPMRAPSSAIFRNEMNAIEQLEHWLVYQRYWCEHKPSITVYVTDEEWMEVGAWTWDHFSEISGISFLPYSDHTYKQAPYQEISEAEYWDWIEIMPKNVDWSDIGDYEQEDNTTSSQTLACTGNICEIVDLTK